jgi:tRNA (cmo5U34)-methyltransferase
MSAHTKSSVEEIRARFDADVERFSKLETGQSATIDAPLTLDLIARAASQVNPHARDLLDIGCGAGNYSLKLLELLPNLNITLMDLSAPMLERAEQRLRVQTKTKIQSFQTDIREITLEPDQYDIVVAAAVLHHLRTDAEWRLVFSKIFQSLRPGGSFWISDIVEHTSPVVQQLMWSRYGEYLTQLKDKAYRDHVFNYIAREDTPKPLLFQLDLLREVGFTDIEILHKNGCFAAFGGVKA